MPNHVTNKIYIEANEEETGEILDAVKSEKEGLGSIDFNKIIPTPENIYQGNLGAEEVAQYGENTWLNFNTKNWGTKWNAYNFNEYNEANVIEFQTAWTVPHPILEKLSEMYPNVQFNHFWADEDLGFNTGEYEYLDGKIIYENIPNGGSKVAYELAAEILDEDLLENGFTFQKTGQVMFMKKKAKTLYSKCK